MIDPRPPRRAPERYERLIPITLVVLVVLFVLVLVGIAAVLFSTLS